MKLFEEIREWGNIRGLKGNDDPQIQMYRLLEEVTELHKAITLNDLPEIVDAIGDIIIVLTQLSKTYNENAEDCLQQAFDVIRLRKGLNKNGSFVRYKKLNKAEQDLCDLKQGAPGNEYFKEQDLHRLEPKDFLH